MSSLGGQVCAKNIKAQLPCNGRGKYDDLQGYMFVVDGILKEKLLF